MIRGLAIGLTLGDRLFLGFGLLGRWPTKLLNETEMRPVKSSAAFEPLLCGRGVSTNTCGGARFELIL